MGKPRVQRQVGYEERRRQDRRDELHRREQLRVCDVRPGEVVGGIALQPSVEVQQLLGDVLVVRRLGHRDTEFAQQAHSQLDGLGDATAEGERVHLNRGGRRTVDDVGPQVLDGPVLLVGLVQPADAVQGGQPAAVQLDPLGGVLDADQPERALQQGVHLRVVGDRPRLLGGAAQQLDHLPAFPRVEDLRRPGQGQELPGRRREEIGRGR